MAGSPARRVFACPHLGPGATNFVTGAAYAQLGGMPLLMITGQKPIKKSKQGQFQIIDVVSMMEPLTKYTRQIVNVDMIPSQVREAFRLAQEERPGAVHLELPEDVAEEPVDAHTTPVFAISRRRRGDANEQAIDDAVAMVKSAEPSVAPSGGGHQPQAHLGIRSLLSRQNGYPFLQHPTGQGSGRLVTIPCSSAPRPCPKGTTSTAPSSAPT